MQIFVQPIVSPGEVFAILIGVGHPPVFCKNLFLQVGDPKGVHQGYHEMTYTKFGRGRSFCKNEVGGRVTSARKCSVILCSGMKIFPKNIS